MARDKEASVRVFVQWANPTTWFQSSTIDGEHERLQMVRPPPPHPSLRFRLVGAAYASNATIGVVLYRGDALEGWCLMGVAVPYRGAGLFSELIDWGAQNLIRNMTPTIRFSWRDPTTMPMRCTGIQ